jgi:AAA+ superfamily predicted ATPase
MTKPQISPSYPGVNILIMGPSGTGKTYSIKSLAATGLETFALFLEPGLETLIGSYVDTCIGITSSQKPRASTSLKSPPTISGNSTLPASPG